MVRFNALSLFCDKDSDLLLLKKIKERNTEIVVRFLNVILIMKFRINKNCSLLKEIMIRIMIYRTKALKFLGYSQNNCPLTKAKKTYWETEHSLMHHLSDEYY